MTKIQTIKTTQARREKVWVYNIQEHKWDILDKHILGLAIDQLVSVCEGRNFKDINDIYTHLDCVYDDGKFEVIISVRPWIDERAIDRAAMTKKDPLTQLTVEHIKGLAIAFEEYSATPNIDLRERQRQGKTQRLFSYKGTMIRVSIDPMRDIGLSGKERDTAKKGMVNL